MRFATHQLTRNGWSDKKVCYWQRFADQLTLYEKKWCVTHPLICHISAVQVAGEFFVEEIDCLTVVLLKFYHCLIRQFRQLFPREPTSLTRVLGSHVTFCFIYAVRIWPPLLGSKKWIQEYPQYIPRRPLSLGPSSSIVLRLCGIPLTNSSVLFSCSILLGFVHFIQ